MEKRIDNLIPLLEFLMELGNVMEEIISTKNFGKLFSLMDEVLKLQNVKWNEVIPELKNLDKNEKKELERVAMEIFDLKNYNI